MSIRLQGTLILASASPRRSELLKLLGLEFAVMPSGVEETALGGESPENHVRRLSAEKAGALADRYPEAWVLGADTVVFIDGELLGKPASVEEAKSMLTKLSGREHQVFTGFTIVCKARNIHAAEAVTSSVLFKDISEEEKNWYVRTDEPYDKAGGYALQGSGAFFVKALCGSYTNVIGLPLCEVIAMLTGLGGIEFSGRM